MRAYSLLIMIFLFWLLEVIFINAFYSDSSAMGFTDENITAISGEQYFNSTTTPSSLGSLGSAFAFMFIAKMPTADMPNFIAFFITAMNWLLVALTVIIVYRMASPFSSG